ncbi:MAG TPA: site-2 protease family protein [Gaiellaceae bacterium]|nr:site-2 protease family protein [Gaiellaceae bacterium]
MSQLTPEQEAELRPYEPYDRGPVRHEPRFRILRKLATPFIALGLLLWKAKFVFVAIFKFKIFTTSASMLVSVGAYALFWGWKFAVGLVLLLFVHELGHYLEARRQGLNVSAPMFIPFLGAAILLRENPQNAWREALVAFGGPIVGTLGAAVVWFVGEQQNSEFLLALAFTGFFLNLFNLLPVVPLDGGRIAAAIHPAIWLVGFVALVGLLFLAPNPLLIIIVVIVGFELYRRWQERGTPQAHAYYEIKPWQRVASAVGYFALAALLVLGMDASYVERDI